MPPSASATQDTAPEPAWEVVAHIWSFYDVPQEGLANFEGKPHVFFEVEENYLPDPEDPEEFIREAVYALHPAPEALAASLREKNEIFERWHQAWVATKGQRTDHPALPQDRERYEALKANIDPQLEALRKTKAARYQVGNFAGNRRAVAPGGSRWASFEVKWTNERSEPASNLEASAPSTADAVKSVLTGGHATIAEAFASDKETLDAIAVEHGDPIAKNDGVMAGPLRQG